VNPRNYQRWVPTHLLVLNTSTVVLALLLLFLASSFEFLSVFEPVLSLVRIVTGLALVTVVPGVLVIEILGIRPSRFGLYVASAIGLTIVIVTLLALLTNVMLGTLGVEDPLSFGILATGLTVVVLGLVGVFRYQDVRLTYPQPNRVEQMSVTTAILGLVPLSVLAALWMRVTDSNMLMFVFVAGVLVVVAATAMRYVPQELYPITVFSVGLGTFLHQNLVTGFVVGADVQALYSTAQLLIEFQQWTPELTGSSISVPVVSLTPATVSLLTGLNLTTVFTVVNVVIFAFVPLLLYYLSNDVFSPEIGIFGCFFFIFYHVSFSFTPGKQLLAGLFVLLILLALFQRQSSAFGRTVAIMLWSIGLIYTHYAATYVFGFTLLLAGLALASFRTLKTDFDARLPIGYPIVFLGVASLWYRFASPQLFETLVSLPGIVVSQVFVLLSTGSIPGSGTSYVQQQTTLLSQLQIGLYILCTVLIAIGVGTLVVRNFSRLRARQVSTEVKYTTLALPLFAFLGSSYFLVLNLWADRVYQMVLVVLAPSLSLGYLALIDQVRAQVPDNWVFPQMRWAILAAILIALFALNSGFAFALVGDAETSTFNTDANDLAFSSDERAGVAWFVNNTNITKTGEYQSTGSRLTADEPDQIQIYTDEKSYQLFRAMLPSSHYTAEVVVLKNKWKPEFEPADIGNGYVYIRHDSVSTEESEPVPPPSITESNRQAIIERGTIVFQNDDVTIVRIGREASE